MARTMINTSGNLSSIFDSALMQLCFHQYHFHLPASYIEWLRMVQGLEDKDFLQLMSTSPHHEAPSFVSGMQAIHDIAQQHCRAAYRSSCSTMLQELAQAATKLIKLNR